LIESYLQKTHAPQHDSYEMSLRTVFEVIKHGEDENFKADIGNRRLLWHGSRLTNWHGILSRGLKIAPKEAPVVSWEQGCNLGVAALLPRNLET
jgi:Poly(ADP-ribose) polymerase catalytic domain.